jgi:uncharacterized membrane protein
MSFLRIVFGMAGIGFRLKGYFSSVSMADRLKGSLYSVVISCGPWLMTILTIAFISVFASDRISEHQLLVFKSIISYSFAFSLIFFGFMEMPLTRYLADKLYIDDKSSFKQIYLLIMLFTLIFGTVCGGIFYSFFTFPFWMALACIVLFSTIVSIWLSMIFLGASKSYKLISYGFIFGSIFTFILSWASGHKFGLVGYTIGYAVGQMTVAVILFSSLYVEFAGREHLSFEFLSYFKKHRTLIFIGALYYCGIWVDKFIFWMTPSGRFVEGLFYTNLYYDTAMFLAYLSIIPALAIFFVHVETNFYMQYAYFFRSVENKENLPLLNKNIQGIHESLRTSLNSLFKFQTFISVILWYFAHEIMVALELPTLMVPIFRYGILGAYLQAFFIFCNIVLLYFLAEREVLRNYTIFFFSNMIISFISAYGDFKFYGCGYTLSCFFTLIASYIALNKRLSMISVHTFMEQPVAQKSTINIA